MSKYSEKLKSPKWQKKRLEILSRDNFTCLGCGDTETELHVHHVKYTKEPYNAPNEDLQTLCKHCHVVIEMINKHPKYKEIPPICKHENMLCVSLPKGNMLFFIIDGELTFNNFVSFDNGSPLVEFLTLTNKDNG